MKDFLEVPLESEDKKILRSDLVQVFIVQILIFSILFLIYLTLYFAQINKYSWYLYAPLFWFFWLVYFLASLRKPLLDLICNKKLIAKSIVKNLTMETKYGNSMNPIYDRKFKTKLDEFWVESSIDTFRVDKRKFESLNQKDLIEISVSFYSRKFIRLEKIII